MGTEKRERQKANRAKRRHEELRQERVTSVRKRVTRIAVVLVLAVAGVVAIAWFSGAFDSDEVVAPAPTSPTDDGDVPVPAGCPDGSEQRREFDDPPPTCIDDDVVYSAVVTTNFGEYTIELDADAAPLAVNNFVVLSRYRYYDDTRCHRIIPDFVVQCGDPTATGTGGPGYRFADELPEPGAYEIGSVAMANSGPDTNGSQFFVVSGPDGAALPPNFTLFGTVVDGLDVIAEMDAAGSADGAPTRPVQIRSVEIVES